MKQSFLEQITTNPDDREIWLLYADWLEKQGDPRGEVVQFWWSLTESVKVKNRTFLESRLQALVQEGVVAVNPTFTNSIGMELVLIPPGRFRMGSPKSDPTHRKNEEQVDVEITRGFWLGKYPVTQKQYEELTGTNPSYFSGTEKPVERVSWHDAVAFSERLTEVERAAERLPFDWEYRLPTEAQWEYACRVGCQTAYHFGDDPALLSEFAWYSENAKRKTRGVGMKKPNTWGLHDMHGNVWEWCRDEYQDQPLGGINPEIINIGIVYRVARGGGWASWAERCRVASRERSEPQSRDEVLGFRLAAFPVIQ